MAFPAGEGAGVHSEGHLDGRFVNRDRRQRNWMLRVGNGLANAKLRQACYRDDFACVSLFNFKPIQPGEDGQVGHLSRVLGPVLFDLDDTLAFGDGA